MALADLLVRIWRFDQTDRPADGEVLGQFFEPEFMQEHTRFASIEEFWAESPWEIAVRGDIEQVPRGELDRYVDRTTRFSDWLAMRNRAAEREIHDRLLV